jgi:hypothetical protein
VIHRWQVVGKMGESEFVAAPYTASGDGVYVRAADYDALAARLAEAERLLRGILDGLVLRGSSWEPKIVEFLGTADSADGEQR